MKEVSLGFSGSRHAILLAHISVANSFQICTPLTIFAKQLHHRCFA